MQADLLALDRITQRGGREISISNTREDELPQLFCIVHEKIEQISNKELSDNWKLFQQHARIPPTFLQSKVLGQVDTSNNNPQLVENGWDSDEDASLPPPALDSINLGTDISPDKVDEKIWKFLLSLHSQYLDLPKVTLSRIADLYYDRYLGKHPEVETDPIAVRDLKLIALFTALKAVTESPVRNQHFIHPFSIKNLDQLNALERHFLNEIGYDTSFDGWNVSFGSLPSGELMETPEFEEFGYDIMDVVKVDRAYFQCIQEEAIARLKAFIQQHEDIQNNVDAIYGLHMTCFLTALLPYTDPENRPHQAIEEHLDITDRELIVLQNILLQETGYHLEAKSILVKALKPIREQLIALNNATINIKLKQHYTNLVNANHCTEVMDATFFIIMEYNSIKFQDSTVEWKDTWNSIARVGSLYANDELNAQNCVKLYLMKIAELTK